MEIVGREATKSERESMLNPFLTNHGEDWTPDSIKSYIESGANFVSKDPNLNQVFAEGIAKLAGNETKKA